MAGVIYSPVSKMNISSLNEKALHALKYHQLLKLSSKYNVRKRWAKKDDLIKSLLAVQSKLQGSSECQDNSANEDMESWADGGEVFKAITPLPEESHNLARSTFTVEKDLLNDSRATYNLGQTINDVLPDFPSNLRDSRLTFDLPKEATKAVAKTTVPLKPKIKMLTVPTSGRLASKVASNKLAPVKESPLKLSNRSIAIKKSRDAMSPIKAARSLLADKKRPVAGSSLSRPQTPQRTVASNLTKTCNISLNTSARLLSLKKDVPQPLITMSRALSQKKALPQPQKENVASAATRLSSSRRKSKSDDPVGRRRSDLLVPSVAASFRTPPAAASSNKRLAASSKKATDVPSKPITVTKMPNFAAIHQRQFEKMDSLDEYINKKSDRVKKLFGTPTTSRPIEKTLKPRNSNSKRLEDLQENSPLINQVQVKTAAPIKTTLDAARKMMNRNPQLRTQTDVKDKNRSHIHGIRSNRRFELQMKFRNI